MLEGRKTTFVEPRLTPVAPRGRRGPDAEVDGIRADAHVREERDPLNLQAGMAARLRRVMGAQCDRIRLCSAYERLAEKLIPQLVLRIGQAAGGTGMNELFAMHPE